MLLSESYKRRLQELAGLVKMDYFSAGDERFNLEDEDAIPFLYYNGELLMKDEGGYFYKRESHWDIINDMVDEFLKARRIAHQVGDYDMMEGYGLTVK